MLIVEHIYNDTSSVSPPLAKKFKATRRLRRPDPAIALGDCTFTLCGTPCLQIPVSSGQTCPVAFASAALHQSDNTEPDPKLLLA